MSLSRAIRRAGTALAVAVVTVGTTVLPAGAADFVFPSCPGFDIGLTPLASYGNPVQAGPRAVIAAGSGTSIIDNETTGATYTFRGAGAFTIEENADGSLTFTSSGQTIVFLFDTDPGGPATIVYTGTVVSMVSPDGTFSVVSSTGRTIDVCALLAG